jgi:hypothetical protein
MRRRREVRKAENAESTLKTPAFITFLFFL